MARTRHRNKKNLATKVAKIQKTLALRAPEKKYTVVNTSAVGQNTSSSGTLVDLLANISQGDSDLNSRTGDRVTLTSCTVKFFNSAPVAAQWLTTRLIFFSFKHNPDSTISAASITNLLMESAFMGTVLAPMTYFDKDNRDSFTVHKDMTYILNNNVATAECASFKTIQVPIGKSARQVQWVNGGATISHNALYMLVLTDYNSNSTIKYVARTNYLDI